jgi:hypothetical protein
VDFKGERIREVSLRSCSCNCEELTSLHQEGEGREGGRERGSRQAGGRQQQVEEGRRRRKKEGERDATLSFRAVWQTADRRKKELWRLDNFSWSCCKVANIDTSIQCNVNFKTRTLLITLMTNKI